jgi:hypothetical protein
MKRQSRTLALRGLPQPPDEVLELVVDGAFKNPQPLDHRIASVWLRTPTNNPTEGYELMLSASFGQEWVTLRGDGFEFRVNFAMTSADIEVEFRNCTAALIEEARHEEAKTTIKEQSSAQSKYSLGAGGEMSASQAGAVGRGFLRGAAERASISLMSVQRSVSRPDYHRTGSNTIQVGPVGDLLRGRIVVDYKGWRVRPNQATDVSAVIARLKVRENWIKFDQVEIISSPPPFTDRLRDIFSREDRRRRNYFKALLVHLTQTALAGYQDGKTATIAANVLVVRPNEDDASSISSRAARHEIDIDGDRICKFLRTEEGQEASVLIALGLKPDTIKPLAERDDREKKRRPKDFVPDCSPTHALEVLHFIHKHGSVAPDRIPHPTTLTNLQSLKLIEKDEQGNFVPAIASRYADPLFLMQRAVSLAECIRVARTVLALNPGAGGREIADAVALELGKEWVVPGTRVRNGNAIKRWTLWLEPYLIDPDSSSYAAAQVAYSRSKKVTKGAPPVIGKRVAAELRALLDQGKSKAELARIFNVSPATIGNWKKRLRLR